MFKLVFPTTEPVLWRVYPLLEFITKVWMEMAKTPQYAPMHGGIKAGLELINSILYLLKHCRQNIGPMCKLPI